MNKEMVLVREALDALDQRLLGRMGDTAESRLRWLVDNLVNRDVAALLPSESMELACGLGLLWPARFKMQEYERMKLPVARRAVADVLNGLLDGRSWSPPGRPVLTLEAGAARFTFEGSNRDALLLGLASLLFHAGDRLRRCQCRRIFVKHRRQEYCSSACSQRARNERRA